jgi:hypothetical protein
VDTPAREDEWVEITEFLTARLGEDEAAARAAFNAPERGNRRPIVPDGRWNVGDEEPGMRRLPEDERDLSWPEYVTGIGIIIYPEGGHTAEHAAHIARHDPARVLREVEAKRAIVAAVAESPGEATGLGVAMLHLAAVYADHPDYRQEWRP